MSLWSRLRNLVSKQQVTKAKYEELKTQVSEYEKIIEEKDRQYRTVLYGIGNAPPEDADINSLYSLFLDATDGREDPDGWALFKIGFGIGPEYSKDQRKEYRERFLDWLEGEQLPDIEYDEQFWREWRSWARENTGKSTK